MERQRILIAIRDPEVVGELRKALVSSGYETKIVDNGASALNLCREFRPHLLLAELDLPKLDGHHLLREIKSQSATKGIPFVLISRHRTVEERVHSINLGVDDYITTPFDANEVILRLEIILKEIEKLEASSTNGTKGFAGRLSEMNLIELLQALEIGHKSCLVTIQNENQEGVILLRNGEILDASLNNLAAKKALFRMFTWNEGSFQVRIKQTDQAKVLKENTVELVRQGLIFRDRWDKLARSLPPLQATVEAVPKLSKEEYSNEERSILGIANGHTRLVDLINKSHLDDLQALSIIARLFYQGSLKEVPVQNDLNGKSFPVRNGHESPGTNEHLSKLVVNFLNPESEPPTDRTDRRHFERRGRDRRLRNRRLSDGVVKKNRIYLNKGELLMIREKLSNGS